MKEITKETATLINVANELDRVAQFLGVLDSARLKRGEKEQMKGAVALARRIIREYDLYKYISHED